jgi:hypothetical protein
MEQLISSADSAIAFIGFLQTVQALPERSARGRVYTNDEKNSVLPSE